MAYRVWWKAKNYEASGIVVEKKGRNRLVRLDNGKQVELNVKSIIRYKEEQEKSEFD